MIGGGGDDLFDAENFDNTSESDDGLEDSVDNEAGEAASGRCKNKGSRGGKGASVKLFW